MEKNDLKRKQEVSRRKVLVVAPHPDDEALGCGGTLLKHVSQHDPVYWMVVTTIPKDGGFPPGMIPRRKKEMAAVHRSFGFSGMHSLEFPTTRLDSIPIREIVEKIGNVISEVGPEIIYVPYPGDVHTDHHVVFEAMSACAKWFRFPTIRRILAYETLSETDFGINPDSAGFRPTVFIDISDFLERKLEILRLYGPEMGKFPFPRSEEAVRALAQLRGATAGCQAAESFMLLKEIA